MRLGLAVGGLERRSIADIERITLAAESCGYELVLAAEAWGRDALVLLGYLAARTRRIRLGTGIVNVFSRSAALIAMATPRSPTACGRSGKRAAATTRLTRSRTR